MLFLRAELAGTLERLVGLRVSPVQAAAGPAPFGRGATVSLAYTLPGSGRVLTWRGRVWTDLPAGTPLRVQGCQVDGATLLLSLLPVRPSPLAGEWLVDRFPLPLAVQSWGVTGLAGISARLRAGCRADRGGLALAGRLRLTLQRGDGELPVALPFARWLAGPFADCLSWQARGGLVELYLAVGPGGVIGGETAVGLFCRGIAPPAGVEPPPAIRLWRSVAATLQAVDGRVIGPGEALVEGALSLETAYVDGAGRSRWVGREEPFSALVSLPDLLPGDRLAVEGRVERAQRVGDSEQVAVALALALTGLRPVHLPLGAALYQVEQVVGAVVHPLSLLLPLREEPVAVPGPMSAQFVALAHGPAPGPALQLQVGPPAQAGGGWQAPVRVGERRLAAGGPLPAGGAGGPQPGLVWVCAADPDGLQLARLTGGAAGSAVLLPDRATRSLHDLTLPEPARGLAIARVVGHQAWVLARLGGGRRHLEPVELTPPAAGLCPVAITAWRPEPGDPDSNRLALAVDWGDAIAQK